jgi:hypothetical protein
VFFPKSPGREGKKDRGENLGWFWHKLKNYLKKYPKFSKNIFLKDKQFVEENEECFEIIFWNILFVLKWNSQN